MEGEREEPDALGRRIGTLRLDERFFDDSVEEITNVYIQGLLHYCHKQRTMTMIICGDMYHKHPTCTCTCM